MNPVDRIIEQKVALRREMRARLAEVNSQNREAWSRRTVEILIANDSWLPPSGVVALFGGMASEPDLLALLPWLKERKVSAAFFAISGEGAMQPHRVRDATELVSGAFGVLTPDTARCPLLREEDLAAVMVPGLAFSVRDGARLGRGRGYYDRVLAKLRSGARVIGLGFSCQMIDDVPHLPHDQCMDSLVSEVGWREIAVP